jgi:hypothetical protein
VEVATDDGPWLAGPEWQIGTPVSPRSKLCLAGTRLHVAVRQSGIAAIRPAIGVRRALHALAGGRPRGAACGIRGRALRVGRALDALVRRTADKGLGGAIRCDETLDAGSGAEVAVRAVGSAVAVGVAGAERMTLVILPAGVCPAAVTVHQALDAPRRLQIASRRGHAAIESRCTVAALTAVRFAHGQRRVRAVCVRQAADAGPGGGVAEPGILRAILRTIGIHSAGGLAGVIGGEAGLSRAAVAALGTCRTSAEHADARPGGCAVRARAALHATEILVAAELASVAGQTAGRASGVRLGLLVVAT